MRILNIIIMLLGCWMIVDAIRFIVLRLLDSFKMRKRIKDATPQTADPAKLCKGPHSWLLASAITKEGPGHVQVCRVCGLISGSDKVASTESIDRIEENIRIRDIEARLLKDFMDTEDGNIKKHFDSEIKSGLNFDKLVQIHTAGMTFSQRFLYYKASKAEEIEKELTKSDA